MESNFRMQGMSVDPPAKPSALSPLYDLTEFQFISPLEFFLTSKRLDSTCKWEEINTCSLCMCELFEGIDDSTELSLLQSIHHQQRKLLDALSRGEALDHEVVALPKCNGVHLYHKDCLSA